ncbi:transporter substrate-binding domain-containing protein [Tropicibacter naphthalenivorans]|uniref:Glutamine-binding periplasmic protein n=1 Tax=Tropicibacter naphthalenivorans TaxID=441103 RepID=A0A0P1FZ87_9RHOB|nr:transporter substrate-binding domain-containing protein [Tropicibacter naphthalenivorans]CUH74743.1 Glutamine-binding periplasmic protein precursor [Tropicibacter naphthalenivorans]SMC49406.1 amino acid ABC transporter substrate-binding protein, PAAT family [Tropicibacter naphthalenivorans]
MKQVWLYLTLVLALLTAGGQAMAQALTFATVERPPFSMGREDQTGFSIDLMRAVSDQLGREVRFVTVDSFGEMLGQVESGAVDGAIANISITAAREAVMDFTLPVFESGLQIMVDGGDRLPLWRQILTWQVAAYLALALVALWGIGMLMWVFERRKQPYFDRPAREAVFPAFWWALNLIVNGGFEERQPRSVPGRIMATGMVFGSLFVVSLFVAQITAAMTVNALTSSVTGLNDLDTRRVGTVAGSTASAFLSARSVEHHTYAGLSDLLEAFETGMINAVVFDAPILRYYLSHEPASDAYLVETVFRAEDYGIALPSGSALREPLNQALLTLRENGSYAALVTNWFGD